MELRHLGRWTMYASALAMMLGVVLVGAALWQPLPEPPTPAPMFGEHEEPRSPEWPKARREYMEAHPDGCAVCGSKIDPQIHHCVPFRIDASRELDQSNLIWLCGPGHENHHLVVGHAGNYCGWNPHVREDAALLKKRYDESRRLANEKRVE